MLDPERAIRDLSSVVADIDRNAIAPAGLEKLAGLNLESLPSGSG